MTSNNSNTEEKHYSLQDHVDEQKHDSTLEQASDCSDFSSSVTRKNTTVQNKNTDWRKCENCSCLLLVTKKKHYFVCKLQQVVFLWDLLESELTLMT